MEDSCEDSSGSKCWYCFVGEHIFAASSKPAAARKLEEFGCVGKCHAKRQWLGEREFGASLNLAAA